MKNIFLIFSNYSRLHLDLGKILNAGRALLEANGLQWQAARNTLWQDWTLDSLAVRYAGLWGCMHGASHHGREKVIREGISAELARLAAVADTGKDLVWFTGPMHVESIRDLSQRLSEHPILSNRRIQPVLLLENQAHAFMDRVKMLWKREDYPWLTPEMGSPGSFAEYYAFYDTLSGLFGSGRIRAFALARRDGLRAALSGLEALFSMPQGSLAGEAYPLPVSHAALDVTHALFKFPFTRNGKIYQDRQKFYKQLIQVENERNFEPARGLLRKAIDYQARFEEQNARLARLLGMDRLFPEEKLPILPDELPVLEPEQARSFAAVLESGQRQAFLRYFRDRREPLTREEEIFAKALDEQRPTSFSSAGFTFPRPKPLLTVLTMTRNHKNYIRECMESVSAQKTSFQIEHVIVDDASDDGSQDIIDDYAATHPHVRAVFLPGRSMGGANIRALFENCKTEYAALCDGDDYFSDPDKLQKQVDFLQANSDCAVCFHPVRAFYENNARPSFIYPEAEFLPRGINGKYYLSDIIKSNFIQTNSVVYRWRFKDGLPSWFRADLCPSDWYWHILHAETGKIGFIPEVMTQYRRHAASYYVTSFASTSVEHRRVHGMNELKTYAALNEHFRDRYMRPLSTLANGVLSDFLRIMVENGDSSLLDEAAQKYPQFVGRFLKELRIVNKKDEAANP